MTVKSKVLCSVYTLLLNSLLMFSSTAWSQTEFYIPKSLIIPVHTHQQEVHVSLGIGGGYDANLSYAITKHFAVFTTGNLNYGTGIRIGFFNRYDIHKNDYAVKGGIGYYAATHHKFVNYIESYAGCGKYKVDKYWYFPGERATSGYDTKAMFWNVFWQFQATQKISNYEFTLALRLTYCKYDNLQYRDRYPGNNDLKTTLDGLYGVTIDPVISYSYIFKHYKFNIQFGGSSSLKSVRLDETSYRILGNQITVSKPPGLTRIGLGAPIGRLSVQHNFDFRKNK